MMAKEIHTIIHTPAQHAFDLVQKLAVGSKITKKVFIKYDCVIYCLKCQGKEILKIQKITDLPHRKMCLGS